MAWLRDIIRGRKADYQATFGTPHGQRVLRDLYERTHLMASDENLFGEELLKVTGMRRIGLHIAQCLNESEASLMRRTNEGEPYAYDPEQGEAA